MNVLIISQNAGSPYHGMVLRNYNWAVALRKMGHEVTVVSSSFSHSRHKNPDVSQSVTREDIDGIEYVWLKGAPYDAKSAFARVRAMFGFVRRLYGFKKFLYKKYDVVIASSPPPFIIYPARAIAKKHGAKLVFDIRDLWPLSVQHLGNISPRHPFIMLMQRAEDYACRHADLVTSVPHNAESYLQSRGLAQGRFLPIGNGIVESDASEAKPLPQDYTERLEALKNQGAFLIGYAGAIGMANCLHILIEALDGANKNAHVAILGHGPYLQDLKNLAKAKSLQNRVHFFAPVDQTQVADFLSRIDVAYIGLANQPVFQYGTSPTKVNDYLRAGLPILYAIGDPNNVVEREGCGISCVPENISSVRNGINTLAQSSENQLQEMGARGRTWLLKHNTVESHMDTFMKKLGEQ